MKLIIVSVFCINEISHAAMALQRTPVDITDVDLSHINQEFEGLSFCFQLHSGLSDSSVDLTKVFPIECDPVLESEHRFSQEGRTVIKIENPIAFLERWFAKDFPALAKIIKINGLRVSFLMQSDEGVSLMREVVKETIHVGLNSDRDDRGSSDEVRLLRASDLDYAVRRFKRNSFLGLVLISIVIMSGGLLLKRHLENKSRTNIIQEQED